MLTIQISRAIITSMKQESDVVLKSSNFRKHKKCSVFFTLISLLLLTVCSCMLFFILTKREPITAKEIFKDNIKSVVEVKAYSEDVGESFGTAEFVDDNGTLVTNAHVVTYTKLEETYEFESYFIRFASDENYIIVDLVKYTFPMFRKYKVILLFLPFYRAFRGLTTNRQKVKAELKVLGK